MKKILFIWLTICSSAYSQIPEILINGNLYDLSMKKEIIIVPKEKILSIEIPSVHNKYFFRLFNFDSTWVSLNGNSIFNYNKLPRGKYFIEIKNNEKLISKIPIVVQAAFWEKWTFMIPMYLFFGIVSAMIIYLFLLYKFRQQARLQTVRTNIAADLHDDIGATLTSIGFFGELIKQKIINRADPKEILPLLAKVIDSSKESVETMRGVVWTINPNNDFALDFFEKLNYYAKEMLSTKNIELEFSASVKEGLELGIEIQRNLFLFFKEAINNILKHAKANQVVVNIILKDKTVEMLISDNGIGFDTLATFEGHGIGNLKTRIGQLNGKLEINSETEKGTNLKVKVPLP